MIPSILLNFWDSRSLDFKPGPTTPHQFSNQIDADACLYQL